MLTANVCVNNLSQRHATTSRTNNQKLILFMIYVQTFGFQQKRQCS